MSDGPPSASGARLAGDDYQHALTWVHALKMLLVDSDVSKVEFEADHAGNVDDLVVHRIGVPTLYQQIKFVVSQKDLLTHDWFTTPPKGKKRSPLQRFHESYVKLASADQVPPEMALQTNRLPAAGDPMLRLISGTNCKLVPRLTHERARSAAGKVRRQWAEHLAITEEWLLSFLEHLAIRAGRSDLDDLQERCAWAMRAVGLRSDVAAVLASLGALRELIRTGVRELDAQAVENLVNRLQLLAERPRATLLIQSLRADPWPETATASVDWVDLYEGEDAASRRQLKNPSDWNERLKPELIAAIEHIRRARLADVDVRGTMRLATGLLVGQQLSEVAGFRISIQGREGEWSSAARREPAELNREELEIKHGEDLAVALAVSQAIREDVLSHIREYKLPVSRLIVLSPADGSSRYSVPDPEAGLGLAAAISAALREETSSHRAALHLFQAAPLPIAVMVGHLWNRMPITHLYEDLGPGAGYTSSFTI
jgi:hypothetical protein